MIAGKLLDLAVLFKKHCGLRTGRAFEHWKIVVVQLTMVSYVSKLRFKRSQQMKSLSALEFQKEYIQKSSESLTKKLKSAKARVSLLKKIQQQKELPLEKLRRENLQLQQGLKEKQQKLLEFFYFLSETLALYYPAK